MPIAPDECANVPASVVAADGSPELLAWWLDCPGRTVEDAEALLLALLELGREDTARAVLTALDGAEA